MIRRVSLFLVIGTLISACGMSLEEKERIAKVTCSIIGETKNIDSAIRVEKVNEARNQIGEEPFLDGDYSIKESIKYGICPELILNDPNYKSLVSALRSEEVKESRRRAEQERKRKKLEEENRKREKRKAYDTLLGAFTEKEGRLLVDCFSRGGGGVLIDFTNMKVRAEEFHRRIPLTINSRIKDNKYTKFTSNVLKGVGDDFLVARVYRLERQVTGDSKVVDKFTTNFGAPPFIKYEKQTPSGEDYNFYGKSCEIQWSK